MTIHWTPLYDESDVPHNQTCSKCVRSRKNRTLVIKGATLTALAGLVIGVGITAWRYREEIKAGVQWTLERRAHETAIREAVAQLAHQVGELKAQAEQIKQALKQHDEAESKQIKLLLTLAKAPRP